MGGEEEIVSGRGRSGRGVNEWEGERREESGWEGKRREESEWEGKRREE